MYEYNAEGFRTYLIKQERSENTINSYLCGLKGYFDMFNEISEEAILEYKEHLKKTVKPKTLNLRITGILNYCKFMGKKIEVKGVKIIKNLSVENVISQGEYEMLTSSLKNDGKEREYWIIVFLAQTGARASELVRFTKLGLKLGYEEMFSKGKNRRIYYPAHLAKECEQYFESIGGNYLFPSRHLGKKSEVMTTRGLSSIIKSVGEFYGIRKEVMHPHGFRHLFAKNFLKNGGDITLLSDLLGHENIGTTSIYTRKSSAEMSEELSSRSVGTINKDGGARHMSEICTPAQLDLISLQRETIQAQREAIEFAKSVLRRYETEEWRR